MHKIYICTLQIGKAQLGAKTCGTEDYIHRRNTASLFIRSTSVETAIYKVSYKLKLERVQRLISIRIAKAYRTVSNEALCILTGLTSIAIKIDEASQFYQLAKGRTKEEALVDRDMEVKYWHHPAETITLLAENNEVTSTIQIFTDRSKSEQRVGAGVAIFRSGNHIRSLKYRLNKRCTDNQAEQLVIVRALEYIENVQTEDKMATIYTDSQISLDSL